MTVMIGTSGWQGLFDREGHLISERAFEPVSIYDAAERQRFGLH